MAPEKRSNQECLDIIFNCAGEYRGTRVDHGIIELSRQQLDAALKELDELKKKPRGNLKTVEK